MPVSRPSDAPDWATGTNYTGGPATGTPSKVAPGGSQVIEGFDPSSRPPAQYHNWLWNNHGLWVKYLDDSAGNGFFGDGSDGAAALSGGTTNLTSDMCYTDLTISANHTINTKGFRIFVSGTLTIGSSSGDDATFRNNANDGHAYTSGGTGGASGDYGSVNGGASGGGGGINIHPDGHDGDSVTEGLGGNGGQGGGNVDNNAGAAGLAPSPTAAQGSWRTLMPMQSGVLIGRTGTFGLQGGAGGGGGAQGRSVEGSGLGGGGGGGGGLVLICAKNIVMVQGNPAFQARGGAGGAGNAGSGGKGGGGGGGGAILLTAKSINLVQGGSLASYAIVAGGAAGAGSGTGPAAGGNGNFYVLNFRSL